MLDDFRDSGDFLEDEEAEISPKSIEPEDNGLLFGMTPTQRFVLAMLFFLSMCLVGSFCLLVTDKIALPLV